MNPEVMKKRTKEFAKRLVKLCRSLPRTAEGKLIGNQLFRSGTSVGSNYRATCRARSKAEFIAKLGVVLEEADETLGWLELVARLELARGAEISWLMGESRELVCIFGSSYATAKEREKEARRRRSNNGESGNRRSPNHRPPDLSNEVTP